MKVVVKNNNLTLLFFLPSVIISKAEATDFSFDHISISLASQLIHGKPKTQASRVPSVMFNPSFYSCMNVSENTGRIKRWLSPECQDTQMSLLTIHYTYWPRTMLGLIHCVA